MLPYTTYLIDLDGVIYRGNKLLPGAREFIAWLETNSKKYLFLTNNSFATGEQILAKLQRLGIAADAAHLLSAGQAAVQHISRRFPGGVVYVIGEQPLLDLVRSQHLVVADPHAEKADAVLVGLDRTFDYAKLNSAIRAIRAGAFFITINRDALLPVEDGETLMIGDSLDVDILGGKAAGTHTLLVLTGRSSRADIDRLHIVPDHVYQDLTALLQAEKSA